MVQQDLPAVMSSHSHTPTPAHLKLVTVETCTAVRVTHINKPPTGLLGHYSTCRCRTLRLTFILVPAVEEAGITVGKGTELLLLLVPVRVWRDWEQRAQRGVTIVIPKGIIGRKQPVNQKEEVDRHTVIHPITINRGYHHSLPLLWLNNVKRRDKEMADNHISSTRLDSPTVEPVQDQAGIVMKAIKTPDRPVKEDMTDDLQRRSRMDDPVYISMRICQVRMGIFQRRKNHQRRYRQSEYTLAL